MFREVIAIDDFLFKFITSWYTQGREKDPGLASNRLSCLVIVHFGLKITYCP
jgi:hypothetical protein